MLESIVVWAKGISVVGKLVGVTATAMVGGTVASAIASPPPQTPPQTNEALTVEQVQQEPSEPVITTSVITEEVSIPFESVTVNDSNTNKGESYIKTSGVNGINTYTYTITMTDGVSTNKVLTNEQVTKQPVSQVTAIGTYVKPAPPKNNCDSNYSGGCVPIASDVDCAGGSGNGPAYVSGPVYVVGSDIYGLDRDNDGIGCE